MVFLPKNSLSKWTVLWEEGQEERRPHPQQLGLGREGSWRSRPRVLSRPLKGQVNLFFPGGEHGRCSAAEKCTTNLL